MKIKVTQCVCGKAQRNKEIKVHGLLWKIPVFAVLVGVVAYNGYLAFFTDELFNPATVRGAFVGILLIVIIDIGRQTSTGMKSGHSLYCALRRPFYAVRGWFLSA